MIKQASEAQISYAGAIAEELGIDLPEQNTMSAYAKFISQNVDEYKTSINLPVRHEQNWSSLNKHYEFCEETFQKIRNLYNHAGVYYFFDEEELVYIGKSKNLGERVFTSLLERADRCTKITHIGIYLTKTMADAHLLEPMLITIYKPKLNVEFKSDDYPTICNEEILEVFNTRPCDVEKMQAYIYDKE